MQKYAVTNQLFFPCPHIRSEVPDVHQTILVSNRTNIQRVLCLKLQKPRTTREYGNSYLEFLKRKTNFVHMGQGAILIMKVYRIIFIHE